MRELWEETPCEHGFMELHRGEDGANYDGWDDRPLCPGGSRRRVRIDYEAAARRYATNALGRKLELVSDAMQDHARDSAAEIVDAALVTEEGT